VKVVFPEDLVGERMEETIAAVNKCSMSLGTRFYVFLIGGNWNLFTALQCTLCEQYTSSSMPKPGTPFPTLLPAKNEIEGVTFRQLELHMFLLLFLSRRSADDFCEGVSKFRKFHQKKI